MTSVRKRLATDSFPLSKLDQRLLAIFNVVLKYTRLVNKGKVTDNLSISLFLNIFS